MLSFAHLQVIKTYRGRIKYRRINAIILRIRFSPLLSTRSVFCPFPVHTCPHLNCRLQLSGRPRSRSRRSADALQVESRGIERMTWAVVNKRNLVQTRSNKHSAYLQLRVLLPLRLRDDSCYLPDMSAAALLNMLLCGSWLKAKALVGRGQPWKVSGKWNGVGSEATGYVIFRLRQVSRESQVKPFPKLQNH